MTVLQYNGRSKRCAFVEEYTAQHSTKFRSHYNPNWYIGFRANGRPLMGAARIPARRAKRPSRNKQRHMRDRKKRPRARARARARAGGGGGGGGGDDCYAFMKRDVSYVNTRGRGEGTYGGPIANFPRAAPSRLAGRGVGSKSAPHRTRHTRRRQKT